MDRRGLVDRRRLGEPVWIELEGRKDIFDISFLTVKIEGSLISISEQGLGSNSSERL